MRKLKRRRGATLGFVAILALVLIAIGVAFFVITKFLGGGREMANATDAGVLNVAKQAIRTPSRDALSFPNPDVGTNFALLGENPRNLNLLIYNRLVAQSMIVALNAKDEGTIDAARNAKRVWTALNDVGKFLRSNHENPNVMGSHFLNLAAANSLKMLGNNGVSMNSYGISFMHRGASTNVAINPVLLDTFASPPAIPTNKSGASSPSGDKYMAGYVPLSVALPTGESLTFSGVTVLPQDRPHLVSLGEFNDKSTDNFVTDLGYPAATIPANAFRASGQTREQHTKGFAGATACAIASSLNQEYQWQIPYGYIIIKNGPSVPAPKSLAATGKDIFSHALAKPGIAVNDEGFFARNLRGSVRGFPNDPLVDRPADWDTKDDQARIAWVEPLMRNAYSAVSSTNLIDQWADINRFCRRVEIIFPGVWELARRFDLPPRGPSFEHVRMPNGDVPTEEQLRTITSFTSNICEWEDYSSAMPKQVCLDKLADFRKGYDQYGSTSDNFVDAEGFNAVEYLKCEVMNKRSMCTNCATVATPPASGMKIFVHKNSYPAPKNAYNFGKQATPYEYLQMIDRAPSGNGCALNSIFQSLLRRCQQMSSKVDATALEGALRLQKLNLGADLYLFMQGDKLVMQAAPPPWMVAGSRADGTTPSIRGGCGTPYPVKYRLVNTATGDGKAGSGSAADDYPSVDYDENTDGGFPGYAWKSAPNIQCMDQAIWTPSTGFNNLLGELSFSNSCLSGGTFCQPN